MVRKYKSMNPKPKKDTQLVLARTINKFTDRNIKSGEKMVRGHK